MSQFFTAGSQNIAVSFSISPSIGNSGRDEGFKVEGSPLGWTGLISLQSKGLSRVFSTIVQKHHFFSAQLSLWSDSHSFN